MDVARRKGMALYTLFMRVSKNFSFLFRVNVVFFFILVDYCLHPVLLNWDLSSFENSVDPDQLAS